MEVKLKIVMEPKFKETIDWFSNEYDKEIGGWIEGTITEDEIRLKGLLIPHQTSGHSSVDMTTKQIIQLRKEYGNKCANIIGEWHSHAKLGAFWSITDDDFVKQYMAPREIGIFIVSSEGKHLIKVEIKKPFAMSLDKLGYVYERVESELGKELKGAIKQKITEPVYATNLVNRSNGYRKKSQYDSGIKIIVDGMVQYFNNGNVVKINGLSWYYADEVEREFEHLKPKTENIGNGTSYNLIFKFKNKKEATDFIKDVKEVLRATLQEERDMISETPSPNHNTNPNNKNLIDIYDYRNWEYE